MRSKSDRISSLRTLELLATALAVCGVCFIFMGKEESAKKPMWQTVLRPGTIDSKSIPADARRAPALTSSTAKLVKLEKKESPPLQEHLSQNSRKARGADLKKILFERRLHNPSDVLLRAKDIGRGSKFAARLNGDYLGMIELDTGETAQVKAKIQTREERSQLYAQISGMLIDEQARVKPFHFVSKIKKLMEVDSGVPDTAIIPMSMTSYLQLYYDSQTKSWFANYYSCEKSPDQYYLVGVVKLGRNGKG